MGLRIITFKLDDELLEKIDIYAQRVGVTRSEFIRQAILMYIAKLEAEIESELRVKMIK
jgi:metal-responsive CopG/Arc/MetJ family transcriptional regulator